MRKILVTGGSGFIGRNLVPFLLSQNHQVVSFSKNRKLDIKDRALTQITGDITSAEDLLKALKGCDSVIHLAVVKNGPDAKRVNIAGAKNLIQCCQKLAIKRIINVSTQSTKIAIQGTYAKTKLASDGLFKKSGLDFTTLKVSLIYSKDKDNLFAQIINYIDKLPFIPVLGDGQWISNPIYIDDLSQIIEKCLGNKNTFRKEFDVGGINGFTFNQIIKSIMQYKQNNKLLISLPFSLSLILAKTVELISKNPPITVNNVLGSNQNTDCQSEKLFKTLNYTPLTFDQGLRKIFGEAGKVRVAVVGLGKMGLFHSILLNTIPEAKLVAICDNNKSLKHSIQSMGINAKFYSDLETLLQKEAIDAVFICTPTFFHYEAIKKALNQSKHVFCEKPLTTDLKESVELSKLAYQKKLVTGVGYFYLFRNLYDKLADIIKTNELGKNLKINIDVRHSEVLKPKKGWIYDKKLSGGGVVINPTSHILAWLIQNFGTPLKVSGDYESLYSESVEDTANIQLQFKNATVNIQTSWSVPNTPILKTDLSVTGSKGSAQLVGNELIIKVGQKKRVIKEEDIVNEKTVNLNPESGSEGYFLEDQRFLQCILRKEKYPYSFSDNLVLAKLIDNFYDQP